MERIMRIFFYLSFFLFFNLNAKQLDKIALVVNDNVFTLSQLKRVQDSIALRKNVSPLVFDKNQFDQNEIAEKMINKIMIKAKLSQIGYSINDEYVEEQIKANEKKLGVNRAQLIQFLNQQNFNFDEYFETIREAIEYSIFIQRVVSPIISITDQEVKNTYYKRNTKNARMNFKYGLTDYSINKDSASSNSFLMAIQNYKKSNIISEEFKEFSINNLDDISEEDISSELVAILKTTDEGSLSKPIMIEGKLHVFYVAKKDLVESTQYLKEKEIIKNELFEKAVIVETKEWFIRERNKHFIKINL
jgi:peptidyl-prolyl cis-trans isomerase SurA